MGAGDFSGGEIIMHRIIKQRKISVHNLDRKACDAMSIKELLEAQNGVLSAKLDEEKGELFVIYDLAETDYGHIGELLEKICIAEDNSLWQSLKESFIRFAEENEKAHILAHADVVAYSPMEEIDEEFEKLD